MLWDFILSFLVCLLSYLYIFCMAHGLLIEHPDFSKSLNGRWALIVSVAMFVVRFCSMLIDNIIVLR